MGAVAFETGLLFSFRREVPLAPFRYNRLQVDFEVDCQLRFSLTITFLLWSYYKLILV